jgi:hypothetical protein
MLQTEYIIIIIHLLISVVYLIYILSGKSYLRLEFIFIIFLVPLFGLLAAIAIELLNIYDKQGKKHIDLLPLTLGEDILWKTLKSFQEAGDIVPLEEAILIDNVKYRRRMMLNAIHDDPLKFLDVLLIARHNKDIETSHYATTTISHSQRRFQLQIQELSVAVESDPGNRELVDEYIEKLEEYIESGLLEKYLLKNQRIMLSKALDKKLTIKKNDKDALIKKIRNEIELGDYVSAFASSDVLKQNYPDEEQAWIEAIRVCVEGNDRKKLQETIHEINELNIDWTKQGKEQISSWLKGGN